MKNAMLFCLASALLLGCGDDKKDKEQEEPNAPDGSVVEDAGDPPDVTPDAATGIDAGTPDCFEGTPTTHLELINACTDAERIDKQPVLPLLPASGELPDLP